MTDTSSTTQASGGGSSSAATSQTPSRQRDGGSELQSSRGVTTISDSVVAKIANLAAREVRGVADLGGAAESAIGGMMGRLRGDEHSTAGVGVEVGERQAAVDIALKVEYPAQVHEVASSVRQNVIDRVENLIGLEVVEVNIGVVDLAFPGSEDQEESQQSQRVE